MALLAAMPFIGRLVAAMFAPRAVANARSFGWPFIVTSLLAMALVVASAKLLLLPAAFEHTFPPTIWCSDRVNTTYILHEYVERSFFAVAATAFGLELGVVAFELWRWRRALHADPRP